MNKKILLVLCAILLVVACTETPQQVSQSLRPIKLGVIAPMSGSNAWIGQAFVPSVQMVVNQTNAAGGINGRQVEIVLEDADTPPKASTAASKLINQDGVAAMYAITTPVVAGSSSVADQAKKVLFGFTAVNSFAKKGTYVFTDLRNVETECSLIGETALKNKDFKLAFVGNDADFTPVCFENLKKALGKDGEVIANEMLPANSPDARTMLTKISDVHPDGLVLLCWPQDCNLIYRQMIELNVLPRLYLPIALPLPASKLATQNIDKAKVFNNAFGTDSILDPEHPTSGLARFIADYESFVGKKDNVPYHDAAVVADNTAMLLGALKKCPDLASDCIRDRLSETEYENYATHVSYQGKHYATRESRVIKYADGKWVSVV